MEKEGIVATREFHWWIVTKDETERPYLVYACPDRDGEAIARQRGMELLSGLDFSLKRYPTRDLNRARSYLAGKRLDEGMGLRESARRQGHEKSLKRLQIRIQKKRATGGFGI